jgi:hypothetical protein
MMDSGICSGSVTVLRADREHYTGPGRRGDPKNSGRRRRWGPEKSGAAAPDASTPWYECISTKRLLEYNFRADRRVKTRGAGGVSDQNVRIFQLSNLTRRMKLRIPRHNDDVDD